MKKAPGAFRRLFRRVALACAVVGFSTALSLLLAEFAVRMVAPQQLIVPYPDLWQPADSVGYLHRPNATVGVNTGERPVTVYTDSLGYRIGRAGRKAAATQVLLIGDSFVEALQVSYEESTADFLEQRLETRLGRPVAVRNGGIDGWDPNHYLIRTRTLLARERFDLVVVSVFVGNDAVRLAVEDHPRREPTERYPLRLPRALSSQELVDAIARPINDGLEAHSHLFVLAKTRASVLRMKLGLTAQYFPVEYTKSEAASDRWTVAASRLARLAEVAARHRTPVLFVLVPERFQVYDNDFEDYVSGFGIDRATVDLDQPSRLLGAAMRERGLRVLDLLDPYRERAKSGPPLFGRVDAHFSPAGHALMAELVEPEAAALMARPATAPRSRR